MELEKLQSAKKLFFILLSIDIAITVIDIGSSIWAIGAMKDIESGARTGDPSLASTIDFWGSFSMIMILTTIGVGLGLVKWLNSCYQFAKESLHATGFKQEGWTVTGWIFPFFNLFKPYQVINEIYRAGSLTYSSGDDWKKESGSGLILTWWIFWAVTHLAMWIVTREIIRKSFDGDMTIKQVIGAYNDQVWLCAISIVIAGLWFVIANHLTQRLVDRSSRYVPKPSFSDSTKAAPISSGQHAVQNAPAVAKLASAERASPIVSKPIVNNQPPVNAMPDIAIESSQQSMPEIEDRLYEQIAQEIETNAVDKGLWTKAYAQTGGDDKQTRVLYIKARFDRLMAAENVKLEAMQQEKEENARLEAMQQEREEVARHEQEQREREEVERFKKLCVRIKVAESTNLDEAKKLAASSEGRDFINWCCWGRIDKVKLAVEKNPLFLAIAATKGGTALHWGVTAKQQEVAKFLADKGASVSTRNEDGKSPIDIAKETGQAELAAFLQQFSVA